MQSAEGYVRNAPNSTILITAAKSANALADKQPTSPPHLMRAGSLNASGHPFDQLSSTVHEFSANRPLLADCCQSSLDLREPQALEIAMQLNGERWHIANKIPFPATVVLSLLSAPDLAEKPAP